MEYGDRKRSLVVLTLLTASIMLLSGMAILGTGSMISGTDAQAKVTQATPGITSTSLVSVPYGNYTFNSTYVSPYMGKMTLFITFQLNHQSKLNSFLSNLSNPFSPQFHHYISRSEFTSMYSPSASFYQSAESYFQQYGKITTYSDRLSFVVQGTSQNIGEMLHTSIGLYQKNGILFYDTTSAPELPSWLGGHVAGIRGLQDLNRPHSTLLSSANMHMSLSQLNLAYSGSGYPVPVNGSTLLPISTVPPTPVVQWLYGSDLQVPYNEQSLFRTWGYPTHAVVATILWAGTNDSNAPVGPFVPSDISTYYNLTLPKGEPHSHVYGMPILGAAPPGRSAAYDSSGANLESTLDLEMVGSMAPGASIYEAYGPNATTANIDAAIAAVLNPSSAYSALNNVSVISNSYGSAEYNDTNLYVMMQEMQARGISFLASAGDTGDSPASLDFALEVNETGPTHATDLVGSPAAQGYNYFGTVSVGGTTTILNANPYSPNFLHIVSDTGWYANAAEALQLGYASGAFGTTSGMSQYFPEPLFQRNIPEVNKVITMEYNSIYNALTTFKGIGVPDISAIGNNTLIWYSSTLEGTGTASAGMGTVAGTSIASPMAAGIIAEIDSVLASHGQGKIGYINPQLYPMANDQLFHHNSNTLAGQSTTYNSSLPVTPMINVVSGHNAAYSDRYGYNAVNGWGAIDAYNYTAMVLGQESAHNSKALRGIGASVDISTLNSTSLYYNTSANRWETSQQFNVTINQNFYIANSLGAPVYWGIGSMELKRISSGLYDATISLTAQYPLVGYGPSFPQTETVTAYHGKVVLPATISMKEWLSDQSTMANQVLYLSVGGTTVSLPVPGGSFIIGAMNYSYSMQGASYTNSVSSTHGNPGGLAPQITIGGAPQFGLAVFGTGSSLSLQPFLEMQGSNSFTDAVSQAVGASSSRTQESSIGASWQQGNGVWSVTSSDGSSSQGIYIHEGSNIARFTESGLPAGVTWAVSADGYTMTSSTSTILFDLSNGTYSYLIDGIPGFHTSPVTGTVSLTGNGASVTVEWMQTVYQVTFAEKGLPSQYAWSMELGGKYQSSSTVQSVFSVPNGTYSFVIYSSGKYNATPPDGTLTVQGSDISMQVQYSTETFTVNFAESGLPSGMNWNVMLSGDSPASYAKTVSGSTESYTVPNGTYSYSVGGIPGYHASSYGGQVSVFGSGVTIHITWTEVTYVVVFNESGLPVGTTWWVNITSGLSEKSNGQSLTFSLPNGTYSYSVASSNKEWRSAGGNLAVSNGSSAVGIFFGKVLYRVSVTEGGLGQSSQWWFNVSGTAQSSRQTEMNLSLPNGTYSYTVSTSNKTERATGGTFTVYGQSQYLKVQFSPVLYRVTFVETGLKQSTKWTVDLGSSVETGSSDNLFFMVTNGTYTYHVQSVAGYRASPSSGTIVVGGSDQSVSVGFTVLTYQMSFTETTLPPGTTWSVNVGGPNGGNYSSTGNSISFQVPNGTYDYTVYAQGYKATTQSGAVVINGSSSNVVVVFTPVTTVAGTPVGESGNTVSMTGEILGIIPYAGIGGSVPSGIFILKRFL